MFQKFVMEQQNYHMMTSHYFNSYGVLWHQLWKDAATRWCILLNCLVWMMIRFLHSDKPFKNHTACSKYTSLMEHNHSFVMLEIVQAMLNLIMGTMIMKQTQTKTATFRIKNKITMETLVSLVWNIWKKSSMVLMENRNQKLFMMAMYMMILFLMTYFFAIISTTLHQQPFNIVSPLKTQVNQQKLMQQILKHCSLKIISRSPHVIIKNLNICRNKSPPRENRDTYIGKKILKSDQKDISLERNIIVSISIREGRRKSSGSEIESFRGLSICTKSYNKWYLSENTWVPCHKSYFKGKYQVVSRMITFTSLLDITKILTQRIQSGGQSVFRFEYMPVILLMLLIN